MRFWDSSAVVPLVVAEPASPEMQELLVLDPVVLVAWATETECASALARLERAGDITAPQGDRAFTRLDELTASWLEVQPTDSVRHTARRLLRVHDLRAADALQLASATIASEGYPSSMELVTLDDRLAAAARREGFVLSVASGG